MQSGERLLLERLDRDRQDVFVAIRLEHAFGVGSIGLVGADIAVGQVGWQQDDRVAELSYFPAPVVRGATGPP